MGYLASSAYFARRGEDERGRTVAGLVYVRNLHAHGLHVGFDLSGKKPTKEERGAAVERVDEAHYVFRPLAAWLRWKPLNELPLPAVPERHGRDV